ncbi:hypothetical protein T12_3935 [Trichinella patagoniensis]|uniref:Uncharacterized protein n=1 Tax=Trichinella patagoniensis TaxID=990121 RepID=A0A0V1A902_9BILA|nr:hypothetical protein T12_3935 [Trichinella patagoniensis]
MDILFHWRAACGPRAMLLDSPSANCCNAAFCVQKYIRCEGLSAQEPHYINIGNLICKFTTP